MKPIVLTMLVSAALMIAAGPAASAPLRMIGWQLHEYNMPLLRKAIPRAARDYGINFIILSHGLIRDANDALDDPKRMADLKELCVLAGENGIDPYLWLHELNDLPAEFMHDRKATFDDPRLRPFLTDRYERLLTQMPEADGIVMTFHESGRRVFRNRETISVLPVPERIYQLSDLIYQVVKKHGKQLILRNFFYEPGEMAWFAEAIARLPDDIIIMSKATPHEFDPYYPPDPMLGKVGKKRQIMEIDLGHENGMTGDGAFAQVDYVGRFIAIAAEKGLVGAVARARFDRHRSLDSIDEINLYAFTRFCKDPALDPEIVWSEWCRKRLPEPAVEPMKAALKKSYDIQIRGRYNLGFWVGKVLDIKTYYYSFGHIRLRSKAKWTNDSEHRRMTELLVYPDADIYERLVAEKDDTLKLCDAALADLDQAAKHLPHDEIEPIRQRFLALRDGIEIVREWTAAFWGFRLWLSTRDEKVLADTRAALDRLRALDADRDRPWGRGADGHRFNIPRFIEEMSWRLEDPDRAKAEDDRILAEIAVRLDPAKN